MCSSGTCIDASPPPPSPAPPPTGTPYGHVVPSDVGKTISVGVVAPVPTEVYSGPLEITQDGTTIENVIINSGGAGIIINANDVTFRNVIVNDNSSRTFYVNEDNKTSGPAYNNLVVEYSRIENTTDGKVFNVNFFTNVTIRNNEVIGGQDWHFMNSELDGFLSENNYYHTVVGSSGSHSDGYQIGEFNVTSGTLTMRGNYYDVDNESIGKTDLLFSTGSESTNSTTIIWENNFMFPHGARTLRCYDSDACIIRNNVYSQEFESWFPAASSRSAAQFQPKNEAASAYECNRYEDGSLIEQQWINGSVTHVTTGCPSYR